MAGFDAGAVVEPMDWDFTRFGGDKGTVPEPSDIEIERFLRKWRILVMQVMVAAKAESDQAAKDEIAQHLKLDEPGTEDGESPALPTMADALELMKSADFSESTVEASNAMAELVAKFCKNQPNKTQIKKLPQRIRAAFYGWLIGQVMDPEFLTVATKPSLKVVSGG